MWHEHWITSRCTCRPQAAAGDRHGVRWISFSPTRDVMEPNLVTDPALVSILEELKRREPIFHQPEFGRTRADLEAMTDPRFWEVGASGRRYSREFCIATVVERHSRSQPDVREWEAVDFHCTRISADSYLLTYTLIEEGARTTRRSTIWQSAADGWRILYHQGTVVEDATA